MDDTRLLVADGSVARLFRTDAELLELVPLRTLKNQHHADHRHRPAGGHDSAHHAEEARFAHELAEVLHADATTNGFRDLVIAAPPAFLGELRSALSGTVAARLNATVSKELADVPDHALPERLRAALADQPLVREP